MLCRYFGCVQNQFSELYINLSTRLHVDESREYEMIRYTEPRSTFEISSGLIGIQICQLKWESVKLLMHKTKLLPIMHKKHNARNEENRNTP